jgi:hypothetical protein
MEGEWRIVGRGGKSKPVIQRKPKETQKKEKIPRKTMVLCPLEVKIEKNELKSLLDAYGEVMDIIIRCFDNKKLSRIKKHRYFIVTYKYREDAMLLLFDIEYEPYKFVNHDDKNLFSNMSMTLLFNNYNLRFKDRIKNDSIENVDTNLKKVFISGFPYDTPKIEIRDWASNFGKLSTTYTIVVKNIKPNQESKFGHSYAFIPYETHKDAKNILTHIHNETLSSLWISEKPFPGMFIRLIGGWSD